DGDVLGERQRGFAGQRTRRPEDLVVRRRQAGRWRGRKIQRVVRVARSRGRLAHRGDLINIAALHLEIIDPSLQDPVAWVWLIAVREIDRRRERGCSSPTRWRYGNRHR